MMRPALLLAALGMLVAAAPALAACVDPPGVETWAWGCASEEPLPVDGSASSVPAGGCRLRAVSQRKNGLQVAYGPWVTVDAPPGSEIEVALPTPPPVLAFA